MRQRSKHGLRWLLLQPFYTRVPRVIRSFHLLLPRWLAPGSAFEVRQCGWRGHRRHCHCPRCPCHHTLQLLLLPLLPLAQAAHGSAAAGRPAILCGSPLPAPRWPDPNDDGRSPGLVHSRTWSTRSSCATSRPSAVPLLPLGRCAPGCCCALKREQPAAADRHRERAACGRAALLKGGVVTAADDSAGTRPPTPLLGPRWTLAFAPCHEKPADAGAAWPQFLEINRLSTLEAALISMGASSVADLEYITDADLIAAGVSQPVLRARLLAAAARQLQGEGRR